jgi:hypothetical protein
MSVVCKIEKESERERARERENLSAKKIKKTEKTLKNKE